MSLTSIWSENGVARCIVCLLSYNFVAPGEHSCPSHRRVLTPENLFCVASFQKDYNRKELDFSHQVARLLPFNKHHVFGLRAMFNQLRYQLEALFFRHSDNFCCVGCNIQRLQARCSNKCLSFFPDEYTNLSSIRSYLDKLVISRRLGGAFAFCR